MVNISEKLRLIMEKRGVTCYELAIQSGVKDMTIWKWLKEKTIPNVKQLNKVCSALYITLAEFFAEQEVVELTDDIKPFVDKWFLLTQKEKESVKLVIDNYTINRGSIGK